MADQEGARSATHTPGLLGGRYEVAELIGRGGMAEVHLGHDTRLGRPVAIKMLRSDLARDLGFLTRFRREAQAAAGLNHPSIVAIFDSGEDVATEAGGGSTPVPYIVMEVVEGRTLREELNTRTVLPSDEAARITEGVLGALAYSHRMGIVHRDVKPANVMISADGDIKVMDFGIARAIADTAATMTQSQAVIGTAQYLSPEQAQGKNVDARSDLYSTGCLLFELLTGRPPFTGDSPVSIAYQHVREQPPAPSSLNHEVPPELDAVVLHALVKDRDGRYQSAEEFRADVAAARAGRSPSAAAAGSAATSRLYVAGPGGPWPTSDDRGNTAALPAIGYDPEGEPRKRRGPAYVLLALACIAAIALVVLAGKSLLQQKPQADLVSVPNVVGQQVDAARRVMVDRGLVPQFNNVSNAVAPQGEVTDQAPERDSRVTTGTTVQISVSSGPGQAPVPNVAGSTQDTARTTLQLAGFDVQAVQLVDESSQQKDKVIGTDPGAGTVVPITTKITLRVASGKVKVPALVGRDRSVATVTLSQLGLLADYTDVETPQAVDGTVLEQTPPGDTVVDVGSRVAVKVAKKPALPPVTVTVTPAPPPPPRTTTPPPPTPTPPSTTTAPPTTTTPPPVTTTAPPPTTTTPPPVTTTAPPPTTPAPTTTTRP